jgi:hypothetical protein
MKQLAVNIVVLTMVLAITTLTQGCLSAWSYKCSADEIKRERIFASGNQRAMSLLTAGASEDTAIRAVALDNGGAGIGLDVSNMQALGKHPFRQIGAAILDAGMLYGGYVGVKSLNDSSSNDNDKNAGRDNNDININGSGNNVNVGDQTSNETGGGSGSEQ